MRAKQGADLSNKKCENHLFSVGQTLFAAGMNACSAGIVAFSLY